jgi:hypothetical protein
MTPAPAEHGNRGLAGWRRQVGIPLGHLRVLMPGERTDHLHGLTAHGQMAGKGIEQIMEPEPAKASAF